MKRLILLIVGGVFLVSGFFAAQAQDLKATILYINAKHEFVVVDLGACNSMRPYQRLSVFKDDKEIAVFKVVEVRNGVSACDVERSSVVIRLGDELILRDSYSISEQMPMMKKAVKKSRLEKKVDKIVCKNEVITDEKKLLLESLVSSEKERKRIEQENKILKEKLQESNTRLKEK